MPGISLLSKYGNYSPQLKSEFLKVLNLMRHAHDYYASILYCDENSLLGLTGYEEYPITIYQSKDYFIIVEGKIYNKAPYKIENELTDIAKIVSSGDKIEETIKRWILKSDGEYIVLIIDKSKHIITIFNDALGRLPTYYMRNDEGVCSL